MGIMVAVVGFTFIAFCVWLAVRLVNRRERWAKRTAWATAGLFLLYPLSLGPACRLAAGPMSLGYMYPIPRVWMSPYWPLGWLASDKASGNLRAANGQPRMFKRLITWYVTLWLPHRTIVPIPATSNGEEFFFVGKG